MCDHKRAWLMLCLLAGCLTPIAGQGAEGDAPRAQGPTAAQVLARLRPLPDTVSRTIMNPYHADPAWKLWAVDPSPVTLVKPHIKGIFRMPRGVRKYPIILRKGSTNLTLEPLGKSQMAGFWDDCYMSLDAHHTRLSAFKGQFIDGGAMRTARDVEAILKLGVNFTSQSYADRGRALVDDQYNHLNTERHFFFANCIRATPSHASYEDKDEARVKDLYDGLFAHSFHSLGQSRSEMHAIYKMMAAGACMPRSTKNLLKKHGAYAIALLTIFKAALPYADAQGEALPYEHELRHRPVYSSHGSPSHLHYCPANAHYHGYSEQQHIQGMLNMARGLVSAPPVAVAKLLSFSVEKDGLTVSDPSRLAQWAKSISLTGMRFWGHKGETLKARINLNESYDLQYKRLRFKCQSLYPNQKNVSIEEEAPGLFLIRVKHDPNLPKGRIPVICTAYNDAEVPSNPVFINFYWPGENQAQGHSPVNVNLRPVVDAGLPGDALPCVPGQTVSIDLKARDPEGFPVTVFRRPGQMGTLEQGRFTATIPSTDRDKIYRVHFIFSDGTGGYTGKQIKLIVASQKDVLPDDWSVSTLGSVHRAAHVRYDNGTFTLGKQPVERHTQQMQGTFVFQPLSGDADLRCRIPKIGKGADAALMITNTLDGFSRHAGIGVFQSKISGVVKPSEQAWGRKASPWKGTGPDRPQYFRLTRRGSEVVGYVSADNETWEEVMTGKVGFFKECYAGLVYRGEPWTTGVCQGLSVAPLQ